MTLDFQTGIFLVLFGVYGQELLRDVYVSCHENGLEYLRYDGDSCRESGLECLRCGCGLYREYALESSCCEYVSCREYARLRDENGGVDVWYIHDGERHLRLLFLSKNGLRIHRQ